MSTNIEIKLPMDMRDVLVENPILAIMRNIPYEDTIEYAEAIVAGGISFFEIALNSPKALEQISLLSDHFQGRCLIGAGTAVTPVLCKAAMEAGAQFLLTPGTPQDVYQYCSRNEIPLLPGVLTPADVATSLEFGYHTMKLFPAGSMPEHYIKDLKGPFSGTDYMAIGGVNRENIKDFYQRGAIAVGLASGLMPKDAVAEKRWDACASYVEELVRQIGTAEG